jgi:hypothetical protein
VRAGDMFQMDERCCCSRQRSASRRQGASGRSPKAKAAGAVAADTLCKDTPIGLRCYYKTVHFRLRCGAEAGTDAWEARGLS